MIVGYVTKLGDRLDNLAYNYMGDPYLYTYIITANPFLPLTIWLQPGIKINIPQLSDIPSQIITSSIWGDSLINTTTNI